MHLKQLIKLTVILIAVVIQYFHLTGQTPVSNKPNAQTQSPAATNVATQPSSYAAGIKINYVRTREALGPITSEADFNSRNYQDVKETTLYLDGLGRPLQTVSRQISPGSTPKDLVSPIVYDEFGREVYKYLPYIQSNGSNTADGSFKLTPFSDQDHFYKNVYRDGNNELMYLGEQVLYSKTDIEASPLNRVLKGMAPGNSWAGNDKGVSQLYLISSATDDVRVWNIGSNPLNYINGDNTNIPTSSLSYAAGELYKNVTIDEHSNAVVEYKDKEGQVVLKKVQAGSVLPDYSGHDNWLCTYYVYDDLNQLRFVIPPKAVEEIKGDWTLTTGILYELSFRYEYDERNRMIAKKVPGAGWIYMVYDKRDRLVFTQDANMRQQSRWMASLYDELNRPVLTGMVNSDRNTLLAHVNGQGSASSTINVTANGSSNLPADASFNLPDFNRTEYYATSSITFEPGFEGTNFIAEIVSPGGPSFSDNVTVFNNPVPSGVNLIPLTLTYYDDYSKTNKPFNASYNNKLEVGNNLHAESPLGSSSARTQGFVTVTKTRVMQDPNDLEVGGWLTTVNYYDDKGRIIQVQSDNYKNGADIITNRYDFIGKVISSYQVHNNPAASVLNFRVSTSMEYDHAGRLLELKKKINDDASTLRSIAKNEYDEIGQLKRKGVGQKRNADGSLSTTDAIETLDYNYNIRGWLTGINRKFSQISGMDDKWFGMELNYDWGFGITQFNGNIAGTKWRSKGDQEHRSYGFTYDKVNRILGSDFSQYESGVYADNAKNTNFDMVIGNGQNTLTGYDENGNIKAMKQWGLKLGGSLLIDNLSYEYSGNQLMRVMDSTATNATLDDYNNNNNQLGDFTDRNYSEINYYLTNDYFFDRNGNLTVDLNKNIVGPAYSNFYPVTPAGIKYNHLNLPFEITICDFNPAHHPYFPNTEFEFTSKGKIKYIYDALGNKLEKRVEDPNASSQDQVNTKTSYLGPFVYENDTLRFFLHEEGRIRPMYPSQMPPLYNYDYFIKDHLGNTRTVLTDEANPVAVYQAGMETANRDLEFALFGDQVHNTAENKPAGFENVPDSTNAKVSQLFGTSVDKVIGPGVILKVMAGDRVKARTYAWYQPTAMDNTTNNYSISAIVGNIISQLTSGISLAGKGIVSQNLAESMVQSGMETFIPTRPSSQSNAPKAYLNWVLLDEVYFKPVNSSSGAVAVPSITGTDPKQLLQAVNGGDIEIKKNGYIYIYVSNESKGNVYFDDIRVEHLKGPLLEETHYYPFGLTMTGISSKAIGKLDNNKKYNGIEFENDLELNIYDAHYRELDPQTGRWWQIDPKIESMEAWSPYASNYNNPVTFSDPLGDEPGSDPPGWFQRTMSAVKQVASDALDYAGGLVTAVADNQSLGLYNQRNENGSRSNNREVFDSGQDAGDIISIGLGAAETVAGGVITLGGLIAAPETGGASLTVSVTGLTVMAVGVNTAAKGAVSLVTQKGRQTGSYTNSHQSGKTYSGKGPKERAKESGNRIAKEHKDPVKKSDWKPSQNTREAFKAEDKRIQKTGGAGSPRNYNKINSPGKKYNEKDQTLKR